MFDALLAAAVSVAAVPIRLVRRYSKTEMPLTYKALSRARIYPLINHYTDPLFDTDSLEDRGLRSLPGIDFNIGQQLELLSSVDNTFDHSIPKNKNFGAGDAELWFHVIRHFKPRRIYEVGSGNSTLIARLAIEANGTECEHICIDPEPRIDLEQSGARVLRRKLETVPIELFDNLQANDILFIDSSHIIRPQGDVVTEYLQIIPRLAPGVIVHAHDIYTPRDYSLYLLKRPIFWNEQYLLEAFLAFNHEWEILLAANMLFHEHYALMKSKCPSLNESSDPASFYFRRISHR